MKINDYIIRGGENLNAPPRKTPSFPEEAEQIFNEWHTKLGKDDEEKENYFELPFNLHFRLFIRAFNIEKPGNRPICFFIGLLVSKEAYIEAKDYYCVNKALCNITFSQIQEAADASFMPLDVSIDWPLPRTTIGLDFQQLSMMKLYGDKDFSSNINQMCLSISTNYIDDWFTRLFIAVNPHRMNRAFHIVISRKQPGPAMSDDKPYPIIHNTGKPTIPLQPTPSESYDNSYGLPQELPNNPPKTRWMLFLIMLFSICLNVYFLITVPLTEYHSLKQQNQSLKMRNESLLKDFVKFKQISKDKDKKIKELETKINNMQK